MLIGKSRAAALQHKLGGVAAICNQGNSSQLEFSADLGRVKPTTRLSNYERLCVIQHEASSSAEGLFMTELGRATLVTA